MPALQRKIEFYKGKSNCEAIIIAAWCLGQMPGGVPGGKAPKTVGFLLSLKRLNSLQANIATPEQV